MRQAEEVVAPRCGHQGRRTVNTHATIMIPVAVLAVADIVWRLSDDLTHPVRPLGSMILSVVVETSGDSPVWHTSVTDGVAGRTASP
jgi:hypothetical protein